MTNLTDIQIALLEAAHGDVAVLNLTSVEDIEVELEKIEDEIVPMGYNYQKDVSGLRSLALAEFESRFSACAADIAKILDPCFEYISVFYQTYYSPRLSEWAGDK